MAERDYAALAASYQADVLSGAAPACRWVKLACERNRRDLDRQDTTAFPYRFVPAAGVRVCTMAEMLPHIKGPCAVVVGKDEQNRNVWASIVLEPWQCWLLMTVFGWQRRDGKRRFRIAFPLVPRKNAKSTIAAIIVLYMLVADGESGAECYSAATTRDQSKVIAEIAWEMAKRSPAFCEHFGVRLGSKTTLTLSVPGTAGKFLPLSADAQSLDGLNVSFAAVDEFHAHRTRAVWDVIDTATGARQQPLLFPITTAGVELGGICHEKLQYLQKILDGVLEDETFWGCYWTIDQGDDIADPMVQRKANPNYGVSVQPDDLQRKIAEAQMSPSALNNVLTKHFNVWIRTESAWMTGTLWQSCAKPGLTIAMLKSYPCWIGVDLAEVRDIAAVVAVFKTSPETYALVGRYYLPEEAIERSPIAQMSGWVRDGLIIETPGNQADFPRIERDILEWCNVLDVQEVDFDRALAAHMQQELKTKLEPRMGRDAVDNFVMTVDQDVKAMDPAMKLTERLVLAKHLEHDGNPAFAWMISNVVVERNYKDEVYPRKAGGKDSANKIDGPVAFWTALSRAMRAPEAKPQFEMLFFGGRRR